MQIRVTVRGLRDASAFRELAESRTATALRRFERRVVRADVRLEDVTGPRKETVDKRCAIDVRLRPRGRVMIEELGDDVEAVLSVALDRLKLSVAREVGRLKRGVGEG